MSTILIVLVVLFLLGAGLGIYAVASLERLPNKHVHMLLEPIQAIRCSSAWLVWRLELVCVGVGGL